MDPQTSHPIPSEGQLKLQTICFSSTCSLFDVCRKIRIQVFVTEQGFDLGDEFDELDQTSVHVLFSLSIRPNEHIGTLRYDPKKAKIGRIALLPPYRRLGIGKQMMLSFERQLVDGLSLIDQAPSSLLDSSTPTQIRLHSQIPVIGFYSTIGYQPVGPTFIEDGAPHQLMVKQLVPC
ncbi:hypothetical protein PGT21_007630 [Puccinia graminis f. sp. tritici]|uniref:N-acetyltransferase domain-containing protein n=1 Tax=Puccinia graminis f. sp. tritici TaxID=56615 RepID=A0A5B0MKC9_PUCGR|nr:hypothetical protein PGT21_007630 [Puccinia graminis f. sp. tritici]